MWRSTLPAILLLLALSSSVPAQFPEQLTPGTRVRLVVRDSTRQEPLLPRQQLIIGTVTALGGETLSLEVPFTTGTIEVPRSSVRQISISRGVPSRAESALRHGVEFAATLALSFYILHELDDAESSFDSGGDAALMGAGIGLGVGALLGAISPSERWRRLRLRE